MNEDDLLARLGTTRAATSTYESDVIRQATYKLAPPLTLDENSVGFPDLINTPLLPFPVQGQAKANRQVVIRVLSQLQRQLQQQCSSSFVANSEEIRLLAMKQQMLLSMLGKHSQKASIQKCWSDQEALEDTYKMTQAQSAMLAPTRKARVPMQQRKQIPGAAKVAQLTEKTARGSSKQNSNKKKQQKRKDWSDSEDSISSDEDNVMYEMNTSSRRRRQAGEQQRGNQGASSSSVKKPAAKAKPKRKQTPVIAAASNRRTTSQETQLVPATRKRTPVKSYAENSDNEEMEFEEEQDASSRVKQEDMIQTNTTTEEKEEAQEDSMEKQASVKQEENTSEQNNNVQTDNANSNKNSNNITCPLCQSTWEVTDSNQMDTELAEHMAQCQNSTARRSTRRATAQRVSRHPVSYKEEEEEDDDDTRFENVDDKEEEKQNTQNRRGKRPASATTTKKRSAKKKIKFSEEVADFDINDEEEEQNSDNDQKQPASELQDDELIFDDDIDKDEELETGPSTKPELSQPEAVDDYRLDDYEDRVDYWRLHGVQQMRDLSKLKAEGEVNPGATVLQGGLHIPAWMNDRLFGYQRTGVEWMWQLHQQEAGGCIGDAMGLGKTVQVSSFLGAMAASRKVRAVLIISPATMLRHWLSELAIWAPGLRRILLHSSGDTSGSSLDVAGRSIANQGPAILRNLRKWLKRARRDRVYERIDHCDGSDEDEEEGHFCGTGYAIITTYEHVRRNQDMYVDHPWSYVVLDEAQ